MFSDIIEKVNDAILKQLEKGVAPWLRPWKSKGGASGLPVNGTTGKAYQGVNIPLLWASSDEHEYQTNEFATFNQWAEKKEFVKKGEKGTMIVYYDKITRPNKDDPEELKTIPFLKSSYVFNRCQLQSYKLTEVEPKANENRIEAVEMFIKNTGAVIEYGGNEACYIPSLDKLKMPHAESFIDLPDCKAIDNFYSVHFHELVHFTGHASRLNRDISNKFGNEKYAKEELVAELGASYLGAEFQIEKAPIENHAAYIEGWMKKLKDEPKTFITASSQASKAVAYLHGQRTV